MKRSADNISIEIYGFPIALRDAKQIRKLSKDGKEIEQLNEDGFGSGSGMSLPDFILAFEKFFEQENVVLVIARDNKDAVVGEGKIIGKATLYIRTLDTMKKVAGIRNFVVLKDYRGTGVGDLLDERLEEISLEHGCAWMEWEIDFPNSPKKHARAVSFCLRRNYEQSATTNVYKKKPRK